MCSLLMGQGQSIRNNICKIGTPLPEVLNCQLLLSSGEISCLPPLSRLVFCLNWNCPCCHNNGKLICLSTRLCQENNLTLQSFTSCFCFCLFVSLWSDLYFYNPQKYHCGKLTCKMMFYHSSLIGIYFSELTSPYAMHQVIKILN